MKRLRIWRAVSGTPQLFRQFIDFMVFSNTVAGLLQGHVVLHQGRVKVGVLSSGIASRFRLDLLKQVVALLAITMCRDQLANEISLNVMVLAQTFVDVHGLPVPVAQSITFVVIHWWFRSS